MAELARLTRLSDTSIYNYIADKAAPSLQRAVLIAQAAGVSVEWLATGREAERQKIESAAAYDPALLRIVIEGVERALREKDLDLKPAEKARFVTLAYDRFAEAPATATVEKVLRLVKSAA